MSRSLPAIVFLLLAVGAVLLFSDRSPRGDALDPSALTRDTPRKSGGTLSVPPENAGARAAEETVEDVRDPLPRTELGPEAPGSGPPSGCTVFGRVVDGDGTPLRNVEVRLEAYRVWTEGEEVPRLPGPHDYRGFRVTTGEGGRFRIEAPPPSVGRTWLSVEPDPYHDSARLFFDSTDGSALPGLTEGERDLGEIRLTETGVVAGRVQAADGRLLEGAEVRLGPNPHSTFQRSSRTAADGTYAVLHAPVGTYGAHASAEGYLSQFQAPVTVVAGQRSDPVDFVLQPAPTIEGIVVDETGAPLEAVEVEGWPTSNGASTDAESGPDGRFRLHLSDNGTFALTARLDGHRTWSSKDDPQRSFGPGARDLRIVLPTVPKVRFLVVDAESGEPIERFGLRILEDNGSGSKQHMYIERRRPKIQKHAGGAVEVTARRGVDLWVVAADGYPLAEGDVAFEEASSPLQRIELQRGASITARVVRDGDAVPGALVQAEKGWLRGGEGDASDTRVFRPDSGRMVRTYTDTEGRLFLEGLDASTYRLTIRPTQGAPLVHIVERLPARRDLDLGDLEVLPGATLEGVVRVPAGIDPESLKVYLDGWTRDAFALTDVSGTFQFSNLAPGTHTLTVDERPGELAATRELVVELGPGETKQIVLDATDRGMCAVDLTLDLGSLSAQGVQVDLFSVDHPFEHTSLGTCSKDGRVGGWVRGWGPTGVRIWLPGPNQLVFPGAPLELIAGGETRVTLSFPFARLRLRLPDGLDLSQAGRVELNLTPNSEEKSPQSFDLDFAEGRLVPTPIAPFENGVLTLLTLNPGRYELVFRVIDEGAQSEQVPLGDGTFRIEQSARYSATRSVLLREGETLELILD